MTLASGSQLGPYVVQSPLGAGGMGEVYRARDTRLGRDVAVKVLPAAYCSDPERLNRFEKEARTAGLLNHPNVLVVYDIGTHDGSPYLVTELLEGETLRDRLRKGRLPATLALNYAAQIARGLVAAHDKDIVHRDLKPENLFVVKDGRIKILDFGLAKLARTASVGAESLTQDMPVTDTGMILGTVGYMSPEQARGEPADHRSDLFAFGAVLYEMLSGVRAYKRDNSIETLHAILNDDPPALSSVRPGLPPALEPIVHHCLEKRPEERFQSARDLAFDLELTAVTMGVATKIASGTRARGVLLARSKRWWLATLVAGAAVLGAVGVTSYLRGKHAAQQPLPTFQRLTFRRGTIESARFTTDGHTIVYSAAWDGEPLHLFMTRREGPDSSPLTAHSAKLLSVSTTGEMALLVRATRNPTGWDGTLAQIPLTGGSPREILDHVSFADWSPDGTQIAVVHMSDVKTRLELPPGHVIYETAGYIGDPRFSPRGDRIAFLDHPLPGDVRGDLVVVDLSGKEQILSRGWADVVGLAWSPDGEEIWFSATKAGMRNELHAVRLSGEHRVVMRLAGTLTLHDIARDGTILLTHEDFRMVIAGLAAGERQERDLSWLDWSYGADISADGRTFLFTEFSASAGPNGAVCLRQTDGTPVVRLGEGRATALSPDGKWALSIVSSQPPRIVLLPTGTGEPRTLEPERIQDCPWAVWTPDGRRIVFAGYEAGHAMRCYLLDIAGGVPRPITPEGTSLYYPSSPVSPDGEFLAAKNVDGRPALFPIEGGPARTLADFTSEDWVMRWSLDGRYIYMQCGGGEIPARLERVEIASGRRELWREITPADAAGASSLGSIRLSDDGKSYVYSYTRRLHNLYLVGGSN